MVAIPAGEMTVNGNPNKLSRPAAFIAGLGLLAMAGLAGYAHFGVFEKLIDRHNAATTAQQIKHALPLFQQGYQAFYTVAGLDVIVAWALYGLFRSAAPNMSLFGASLRTLYAGGLAYATWQLQLAYEIYGRMPAAPSAFARVQSFYTFWETGLILFGFHLLVIGWLVFTDKRLSAAIAAILGTLLIITGLGYVVDSIAFLFYPATSFAITNYTFVGEMIFMAWLLWTGITGGRKA
jgi:hypothetical protein